MLNIKENISLKAFNTFGIDVKAKKYISLNKPEDVNDLLHSSILNSEEFLIIGEGSNLLFVKDYNGIIIHPKFKGINIHKKEDDFVFIEAYAGENWDTFVHYCTNNNYGGLENLSLIPGTVGASAIQNIGAYGMEAKDKIWQVCGFDLIEKKHKTFSNKECHFEYRNSIFKSEFKNRFIVTSVIYKLSTKNHNLNYHYGALQSVLNDCAEINIQNIHIHLQVEPMKPIH